VCFHQVVIPEINIMRDISEIKNGHVPGEKTVYKVQYFHNDPVLFNFCKDPNVSCTSSAAVSFVGMLLFRKF